MNSRTSPAWSDAERARLGRVLADALYEFRGLWSDGARERVGPTVPEHRLGFLRRSELASVAIDAAMTEIVEPIAEIGIELTDAERERIFA